MVAASISFAAASERSISLDPTWVLARFLRQVALVEIPYFG